MATSSPKLLFFAALLALGCATKGADNVRLPASEPLWLRATDRSRVNLEGLWRSHRATVLIFWSSQCPCVRRYQTRVEALAARYSANQVLVVGIASNADESLDDALRVAQQRGVSIPIFRDEGGQVARAVSARSTPTVVLIDRSGTIRYRGWIDNERLPGDPGREPWLERAIQGVLEGRNDFTPRSPVYGCAITRSLLASSSAACCKGSDQ
jgi:thiol-disulfide isomerase/thioredoxin